MKINTEDLVSSLLFIGFDKVDSVLFSYTLRKISTQSTFQFEDHMLTKSFNNYIEFDGISFKLKEGLSLDKSKKDYNPSFRMALIRKQELTNYLKTIDFSEIIERIPLVSKPNPKTKVLAVKSSN